MFNFIFKSNSFCTDPPQRLRLTFKSELEFGNHSSKVGSYCIMDKFFNGKHYWKQTQGQGNNIIWFNDETSSWNIGPNKSLGTLECGIFSQEYVSWPNEIKHWQYVSNNQEWIQSDNIIVENGNDPNREIIFIFHSYP